ncbi:MAG: dihydrofolate reductase family protein [Cyanobacteria bacterium]|nr:dihydrofolate reductase family protein [Cyanobacteriota bacterium]
MQKLRTLEDCSDRFPVTGIGNAWSREYYDGPFYLVAAPSGRPAISLVFVQTRDGNTGASNPEDLGGGPTDKHLIYEGLSRVAADGVLAGASSVGRSVFFTISEPQLVALRRDLGLPRHLAQIVMSNDGNFDLSARIFTTPDVPVFLLAGNQCIAKVGADVRRRPWITMIAIGGGLPGTFKRLRDEHGIGRISAVGGRVTATSLVDAGLVQDIYLTTSPIEGGEPDTPWYVGKRAPKLDLIVSKRELAPSPIVFEHLMIG